MSYTQNCFLSKFYASNLIDIMITAMTSCWNFDGLYASNI
jgi:hypothetical protein